MSGIIVVCVFTKDIFNVCLYLLGMMLRVKFRVKTDDCFFFTLNFCMITFASIAHMIVILNQSTQLTLRCMNSLKLEFPITEVMKFLSSNCFFMTETQKNLQMFMCSLLISLELKSDENLFYIKLGKVPFILLLCE